MTSPGEYVADLVNLVVPTNLTFVNIDKLWVGASENFAGGNRSERGVYLGLPALLIVALFTLKRRKTGEARFLVYCLGAAILLELGAYAHIFPYKFLLPLPWAAVDHLPLFNHVVPIRIALYASLCSAVIVALWATSTKSRLARYALPVIAVVAVLPAPGSQAWIDRPSNPRFFADGIYRSCLGRDETVVVRQFRRDRDGLIWQAESRFWFRLVGGSLGPYFPASYVRFRALLDPTAPHDPTSTLQLARAKGADTVIADGSQTARFRKAIPKPAVDVAGVRVYRLPGATPLSARCLRYIDPPRGSTE